MKQRANSTWYDVHEGFVAVFKRYGKPVPHISRHSFMFTQEEFERFAEACRESEARSLKTKSLAENKP